MFLSGCKILIIFLRVSSLYRRVILPQQRLDSPCKQKAIVVNRIYIYLIFTVRELGRSAASQRLDDFSVSIAKVNK